MQMEFGCSKYYYQKNDLVTTCLMTSTTGKVIARGIAICGPGDTIDKAEGRHWAKRRAKRALLGRMGDIPFKDKSGNMVTKKDTIVRRPEAKEIIKGTGFGKKSYINPKLTTLERQLLPHI